MQLNCQYGHSLGHEGCQDDGGSRIGEIEDKALKLLVELGLATRCSVMRVQKRVKGDRTRKQELQRRTYFLHVEKVLGKL